MPSSSCKARRLITGIACATSRLMSDLPAEQLPEGPGGRRQAYRRELHRSSARQHRPAQPGGPVTGGTADGTIDVDLVQVVAWRPSCPRRSAHLSSCASARLRLGLRVTGIGSPRVRSQIGVTSAGMTRHTAAAAYVRFGWIRPR
jgi:hypothetical protein